MRCIKKFRWSGNYSPSLRGVSRSNLFCAWRLLRSVASRTSATALAMTALFLINGQTYAQNGNVGIGTLAPDASAVLHLEATDKGLLIPRLTTAQRTAISAPEQSLLVYDTDAECFFYYESSAGNWENLCAMGGVTGATGMTGATGTVGATGVTGSTGITGA